MSDEDAGGGASRSTDPAAGSSTGTDVSLREHLEALRQADRRLEVERDRRYSELAIEREKALKIKETADLAALDLARQIQTYKDEKANELREQINSERGLYLTREEYSAAHVALAEKMDQAVKPLAEFVQSQQGRQQGIGVIAATIVGSVTVIAAVVAIVIKLVGG